MSQETFWAILLVLLAVCVGFLLPLLVQLRRTARQAEKFMTATQTDLVPLLKDLRETSEKAAKLASAAEEDFGRLTPLFRSLGDAGQTLHALTGPLNADMFRYAGSVLGFWLGMRNMKNAFPAKKKHTQEGE